MPLIFNYRSIVLLNTVVLLHFVRRRQISLLNLLVIPLGRSSRLARFTQSTHLKRRRGSAVVFHEERDKGRYDGYARHEDPPEVTSEDILVDRECVDLEHVVRGDVSESERFGGDVGRLTELTNQGPMTRLRHWTHVLTPFRAPRAPLSGQASCTMTIPTELLIPREIPGVSHSTICTLS